MSIVFTLLLFVPVVLLALLLFAGVFSKVNKPRFAPRLSKSVFWIYCAVLLSSPFIVHRLPTDPLVRNAAVDSPQYTQAQQAASHFYEITKEGKLDSTPGIYKYASQSYPINGNRLGIVSNGNPDFELVVERKDGDDSTIEVSTYGTAFVFQNININQRIPSPKIILEENLLTIHPPESISLNYIRFSYDLTAIQFIGNFSMRNLFPEPTLLGREAVVLQIPKSLEIDTNIENITYLN